MQALPSAAPRRHQTWDGLGGPRVCSVEGLMGNMSETEEPQRGAGASDGFLAAIAQFDWLKIPGAVRAICAHRNRSWRCGGRLARRGPGQG